MTLKQQIITVALCVLGTVLSRFTPFIVFSENNKTPKLVDYLGKALPGAVFGMLVIYCLKEVDFTRGSFGIPEGVGVVVTYLLHKWKRQMMISIVGGTICYMILVRIFA